MSTNPKTININTRKTLPRRTLLCGLGTTLALPLLDAMTPGFSTNASALGAAKAPIHRFQTFYVPNGMAMPYWTPEKTGRDFELTPILEPLAPYKDQMLVLSGLKANWNLAHAGASGSFLTGVTRGGRNEVEILADVSVDQLLLPSWEKRLNCHLLSFQWIRPQTLEHAQQILVVYTHLRFRGMAPPTPFPWNTTHGQYLKDYSAIAAARVELPVKHA